MVGSHEAVGRGHVDRLQYCTVTIPCFLGTELIFGRLSLAASVPKLRHCTNRKGPCGARELWVLWCSGPPPQCRPLDTPGLFLSCSLLALS